MWLRNIQLGLFALPLALATALWSDGPQLRAYGLLQGFDSTVVWGVVRRHSASHPNPNPYPSPYPYPYPYPCPYPYLYP